jgi:uncharacterized protein (TIGR00369 family)
MTAFTFLDPNFESRVRANFTRQSMLSTLGGEVGMVCPGEVHLLMPFGSHLTQQDGFLHAGVVATLMDSACGYAAFSLMPADARVLSVEFKVNLLAPARGERFRAEGRVVKAGRTITVCEGKAFSIHNEEEALCALMQATMICIRDNNK